MTIFFSKILELIAKPNPIIPKYHTLKHIFVSKCFKRFYDLVNIVQNLHSNLKSLFLKKLSNNILLASRVKSKSQRNYT